MCENAVLLFWFGFLKYSCASSVFTLSIVIISARFSISQNV